MHRRHLAFSSLSSLALMGGGAALASAGAVDWGLFWVGGIIAAVSLVSAWRLVARAYQIPLLVPVDVTSRLSAPGSR